MALFESSPPENPKIGLCLCGGGARGIAHAGVLQALCEQGIDIQYVSGASMGSIVGAFFAEGLKPKQILAILSKPRFYKAFRIGFPDEGLTDLSYLKNMLKDNIKSDDFADLQKKLFVCVSNLNTGQYEIISEGKLSQAVIASSAIPLIFKPVRMNNALYVDGGMLNNLPIEPLRDICQVVIGVNVNGHQATTEKIEGLWAIGERCANLMLWENVQKRITLCDIIIDIKEVYKYGVFDFAAAEQIYQAGYQQTIAQMPEILLKINGKVKKNKLLRFWG